MSGVMSMLSSGLRGAGRRRGLVLSLYLVQLAVALLFTVVVARALAMIYGHRPLFDRAVAGDDTALFLSILPRIAVHQALAIAGMGMAFGYLILSFFLTGGLVGSFAGRPFAESGARAFMPFFRLWLWSLIPYAVCAAAIALGLVLADVSILESPTLSRLVGRPLLLAAPGMVLLVVVLCAVDYAKVDLVVSDRRGAFKALLRGFARVFRRPAPLAHYVTFLLFWLGVSMLYVAITFGHAFAGAAGVWILFALRQITAFLRFGGRIVTTGGQVALALADATVVKDDNRPPV